jgi:hypothetical protein
LTSWYKLFSVRVTNRSSERNAYPRVSFTRGYTQLTMLSADERVGQLFVLALLLQTKPGRDVLRPRFETGFDSRRDAAKDKFLGGISEPSIATSVSGHEDELSSYADDESLTHDERRYHTDQEDGSISDVSEDGNLSEAQIKLALDNLDLSYVLDGIRPFLDSFHKQRLDKVLAEVLTTNAFNAVSQVALPPNLTDYRTSPPNVTVPVPFFPQAAIPAVIQEFEVDEDREDNSIKLPMDKFVYLVETVLSLHAFLKYGCSLLVTSPTGIADYKMALEVFLHILVATVDRGADSNQWCLQKMLELVHFLDDVLDFGPASGFSTETGERGLKKWAKAPAKTAQKRSDEVFSRQVCMRIHESVLINCIADANPLDNDIMEEEEEGAANTEVRLRCANFVVELHQTAIVTRVLSSGKNHGIQIDFPEVIVAWFAKHFLDPDTPRRIQLYTEIVLPGVSGQPGTLLRAHPNYQSDGPWYDFALASYDEENRNDPTTYPCKMSCFFKDPDTNKTMALVQEVEFQARAETLRESQLFNHWRLKSKENRTERRRDAVLEAISVESLSDRIYALDPKPVGGFSRKDAADFNILVAKYSKEQWPASFLESPKYLDSYTWD